MIPCHICGKDASLGWVKGFIPAPDSQKLALCAEHDTEANRAELVKAWHLMMIKGIRTATEVAALQATKGSPQMLTLHFTAGGSLSLPCVSSEITPHGTLKAKGPDGTLSFFPVQQIKRYDLTPLPPDRALPPPTPPQLKSSSS